MPGELVLSPSACVPLPLLYHDLSRTKEEVSLPETSLKPSLISRALEAPGHPLRTSIEPLLPGRERGSWLQLSERLQGGTACLEGEKLFPQVGSHWDTPEGGVLNPFFAAGMG